MMSVSSLVFPQENPAITQKLMSKYSFVKYLTIEDEGHSCYLVKSKSTSLYGICDVNGKEIVPPISDGGMSKSGNFYLYIKDKKMGAYDLKGNLIIPAKKYHSIFNLNKKVDLYEVIIMPNYPKSVGDLHGVIDSKGKEIIPCIFDFIRIDDEDIPLEHIKVKKDKKCGVYSFKGKEIETPKWSSVERLNENSDEYYLAYIYGSGDAKTKVALLDKNQKEIVPCNYDWISPDTTYLNKGLVMVQQNNNYGIYSIKGKLLVPCSYHFIKLFDGETELIFVSVSGPNPDKWTEGAKDGVYNFEGKEILPCVYDNVDNYNFRHFLNKGLIAAQLNGKWGVCDNKGKEVISYKYSYVCTDPSTDLVIVTEGGSCENLLSKPINAKWGVLDANGKRIVDCIYDYIEIPSDGLILCNKGGEVDTKGEVQGGQYGYLDYQGNIIFPLEYENASSFHDGVAQVTKNGISSILVNPLSGTNLQVANGGASIKVDTNIPETGKNDENTFAFIFANENYTHFSGADYSINDGKVFKQYCQKTMGIPEKNIRYYEDATFGNFVGALQKLKDIADVYDGEAKFIFYYSGLGTADNNNMAFLLPTDASLDALGTTGYGLQKLMDELNSLNTEMTLVIIDAPFSGADKAGNMLDQSRKVALRSKSVPAIGNTILCISGNQGESVRSDKKYGHSLFTYGILEKIQSTKGDCLIKDVIDYSTQWVKKESLSNYDKVQSPQTIVSEKIKNAWNGLKW